MSQKLLETFAKRINLAESVYSQRHSDTMSNRKKMVLATLLNNTNKFLTEAYSAANATQQSSLGMWKKFCL